MTNLEKKLELQLKRWLTPKAESYTSPKHELGIRAIEKISKGEDVLVYGGVIIHLDEAQEYWRLMGHTGTQIDDTFLLYLQIEKRLKKQGL
ncbi:MAG: hypothetical protein Q9M91_06980 [Candidatus Dojkabacteria bacterium]|nr:hypothetical protein [Candidatus Dojkabacteria bacterium]MDQ7021536.1 hypothetical protein [Candidatus Dojkabacteria bacterium]